MNRGCALGTAPPIIVVGPPRSGTTLVTELIARMPGAVCWMEPKYLWRWGAQSRGYDERAAIEASEQVRRAIRSRLSRYLRRCGNGWLVEKTPSNCLRLGFVDNVVPEAKYVFVSRRSEQTIASAYRRWLGARDWRAMTKRFRQPDLPVRQWFGVGVGALRKRQLEKVATKQMWGATPEGIESVLRDEGVLAGVGYQWARCAEGMESFARECSRPRAHVVCYEELLDNPSVELDKLGEFIGTEGQREWRKACVGSVQRRSNGGLEGERMPARIAHRVAASERMLRKTLEEFQ